MNGGCCPGREFRCCADRERRRVEIDFLYLDLNVCTRCKGTDASLDAALVEVSDVLNASGFDVVVNKVNITSRELAIKYEFMSSPTIRVNGRDIEPNVKESSCESCGGLCGGSVDCRVWMRDGTEYAVPPKELIVNAVLREVCSDARTSDQDKREYRIPHNLEVFFQGALGSA